MAHGCRSAWPSYEPEGAVVQAGISCVKEAGHGGGSAPFLRLKMEARFCFVF